MISNPEKAWLVVAMHGQTQRLFRSLTRDQVERLAACVRADGSYTDDVHEVWRAVFIEHCESQKATIDED